MRNGLRIWADDARPMSWFRLRRAAFSGWRHRGAQRQPRFQFLFRCQQFHHAFDVHGQRGQQHLAQNLRLSAIAGLATALVPYHLAQLVPSPDAGNGPSLRPDRTPADPDRTALSLCLASTWPSLTQWRYSPYDFVQPALLLRQTS